MNWGRTPHSPRLVVGALASANGGRTKSRQSKNSAISFLGIPREIAARLAAARSTSVLALAKQRLALSYAMAEPTPSLFTKRSARRQSADLSRVNGPLTIRSPFMLVAAARAARLLAVGRCRIAPPYLRTEKFSTVDGQRPRLVHRLRRMILGLVRQMLSINNRWGGRMGRR